MQDIGAQEVLTSLALRICPVEHRMHPRIELNEREHNDR